VEEGFGIDGAGEVDVEVCALGELRQKRLESDGSLGGVGLVGASGAGFGFRNAMGRLGAGGGEQNEAGEEAGGNADWAAHGCFPV